MASAGDAHAAEAVSMAVEGDAQPPPVAQQVPPPAAVMMKACSQTSDDSGVAKDSSQSPHSHEESRDSTRDSTRETASASASASASAPASVSKDSPTEDEQMTDAATEDDSHSNVSEKEWFARSAALWREYDTTDAAANVVAKPLGGRTCSIMRDAKRNHRTDVSSKAWGKYGHASRWEALKERLTRECLENVERVHGACLTMEQLRERFERPVLPCVVQGLADDWPARTEWSLDQLRHDYGERVFKCGEDDDGYSIKIKLKHFFRYLASDAPDGAKSDDSPLYIFDSHYDDDKVAKAMLGQYSVPHLFREDLFQFAGEDRRPPYRWFLVGPPRSGSSVHVDPLGTSAWNTLVRGHKLWTLFPPDVARSVVKGREHVDFSTEDDEPVDWNANVLQRILEQGGPALRARMIQFIQRPGETVFVPSNWWHGVLNLDTTVAVTQNFCSSGNFECVWRNTRTGRRKMARTWRRVLEKPHPELHAMAHHIDRADGFDLDEDIKQAEARKVAKKAEKKQKKLLKQQAAAKK